ncbi:hypothetical protein EXIGLDRAFT_733264 [Exidia glandulosa HHB12029]|uniref:Uncharacterized protein n=1 Tax=Exidia glandulosa HHB12029 TaxID=1314781 RepID=A0A165BC77_EXIGL|nr:hypothetical protein EXIGLDRAFT_733264 [Exidia glandulosa HHB12029]
MNTGSCIHLLHHPASPCVRSPSTCRTCRRSQSILIPAAPRRVLEYAARAIVGGLGATGPSSRPSWVTLEATLATQYVMSWTT